MSRTCPVCQSALDTRALLMRATTACPTCGATLALGTLGQWLLAALGSLAALLGVLFATAPLNGPAGLLLALGAALVTLLGLGAWLLKPVETKRR